MRLTFLLLIALFSTAFAADEPSKLPAAAQAEIKDYDTDVAKLKAAYDAGVVKRAVELSKVLNKLQADTTKKGDLDGALAIKGAIEKLPIDRLDDLGNRIPAPSAQDKKNDVLEKSVIGQWRIDGRNQLITAKQDHSAVCDAVAGSWTFDKESGCVRFTWANNTLWGMKPSGGARAPFWEESTTGAHVSDLSGERLNTGTGK